MMELKDWLPDDVSKLNLLIEFNNEAIKIANDAKAKIPENDYPLFDFVCIGFFNRFIDTLISTNILLQHYKENRNVETSIGLTFRASLLDFMIAVYFGSYELEIDEAKPETNQKLDNVLTSFICDQLKYTIKHMELMKKSHIITTAEFSRVLKNFYEKHKVFFTHFDEKDLCNCLKGKKFSVTDMFTRIHQDKQLKHLSVVYDYYTFYSKYDHFGVLTNSMQNMSVSEEFARIRLSYGYIYQGLISMLLKVSETLNGLVEHAHNLKCLYNRAVPILTK